MHFQTCFLLVQTLTSFSRQKKNAKLTNVYLNKPSPSPPLGFLFSFIIYTDVPYSGSGPLPGGGGDRD